MFYKLLTGDRIRTAAIIFLLALGIWIPAFLSPEIIIDGAIGSSMPFYQLSNIALEGNLLFSRLLTFGLMLIEAVLLVRINAKHVLVQKKTFLPALFFILISSHTPLLMQWNPVLPAALFLIFILDVNFHSYSSGPGNYKFFDVGILLGLASLFYAPMIYLLVFIWIAILVQRPFFWREYLFPLLGLIVPYVFVFAFLFFADRSIPEFLQGLGSDFIFDYDIPHYNWINLIFGIYLGFLVILSSVFMLKVFQFRKIYTRDYFMVLFWLFISGSAIFLLLSGFNSGLSYVVGIPISFILTNYFANAREKIENKVLLYLLISFAIFMAISGVIE